MSRIPWALLTALAILAAIVALIAGRDTIAKFARGPGLTVPAATSRAGADAVVFDPKPAAAMNVSATTLGVSPDGLARWLVVAHFTDADGAPTQLLRGGDVSLTAVPQDCDPARPNPCARHATVQWQTRLRFGGPAIIVATPDRGRFAVRAIASVGVPIAPVSATIDVRAVLGPQIVAKPLGPHAVRVGWFPRVPGERVRIARDGLSAEVDSTISSYLDANLEPGRSYRYTVATGESAPVTLTVRMPSELPVVPLKNLRGTKMWLSFSANPGDADAFDRFDAQTIADRAKSAGLRAIELRVGYGPFSELTRASTPFVDGVIDAAAAAGIEVIAWTVPRSRDFDDVALAAELAAHRTQAGHGFAGLAIDLERGSDYLGEGAGGYAALAEYLGDVRAAVGPKYPLIATVEDAYLEHLDERVYPYAEIARSASVLQPMSYWRMLSKKAVTPRGVDQALRGSFAKLAKEAATPVPIDIGGQTSNEGPRGAPPAGEIAASLATASDLHAFGITFFDWSATSDEQWRAIGAGAGGTARTR